MAIDLKEIINSCFNNSTKNVERYTHNGSTWLIFTDEKKWVIELTKEGTLWYNYYFFQNIMKLLSLDVVENQHYITKWVEDTIINPVKHTESVDGYGFDLTWVEDTIQNGVKHTEYGDWEDGDERFDDIIQNGVKNTKPNLLMSELTIEETIQNGVKRTELGGKDRKIGEIKDIIENGVKETTPGGFLGRYDIRGEKIYKFEVAKQDNDVEDVIQSGIKETKSVHIHNGEPIESVIQNGIKETWGYEKQPQNRIDEVIINGQKD